ncbi:DUF6266 family protein [Sphingobacterium siyangense]|uniref:DUF6266 family protein n=1 Tax=Sphingobacterium siyangense TaxID=459529 RepID=UPI001F051532|nr:DUF6266 family protein [Sphingobacterium siyangense]
MLVISEFKKQDKDPTRRQAAQDRFRLARRFLNPLYPLILKGFSHSKCTVQVAFGRAMSHTLTNVIQGEYPDFEIVPALAKISNGMLSPLAVNSCVRTSNTIQLSWDVTESNIKDYSQWDDQVILCAYDVIGGQAAINEQQVLRKDLQMTIELPSILHDKAVHLYLFLHDRDENLYSRSQYLGLF